MAYGAPSGRPLKGCSLPLQCGEDALEPVQSVAEEAPVTVNGLGDAIESDVRVEFDFYRVRLLSRVHERLAGSIWCLLSGAFLMVLR